MTISRDIDKNSGREHILFCIDAGISVYKIKISTELSGELEIREHQITLVSKSLIVGGSRGKVRGGGVDYSNTGLRPCGCVQIIVRQKHEYSGMFDSLVLDIRGCGYHKRNIIDFTIMDQ